MNSFWGNPVPATVVSDVMGEKYIVIVTSYTVIGSLHNFSKKAHKMKEKKGNYMTKQYISVGSLSATDNTVPVVCVCGDTS